mgnify:CR=1 FL=1
MAVQKKTPAKTKSATKTKTKTATLTSYSPSRNRMAGEPPVAKPALTGQTKTRRSRCMPSQTLPIRYDSVKT